MIGQKENKKRTLYSESSRRIIWRKIFKTGEMYLLE